MGKATLIILLSSILLTSTVNISINKNLNEATGTAVNYFSGIQARNIANSMVNMLLSELADSVSYRQIKPKMKNFFGGKVSFTVIDTSFTDSNLEEGGDGGNKDKNDNNKNDDEGDRKKKEKKKKKRNKKKGDDDENEGDEGDDGDDGDSENIDPLIKIRVSATYNGVTKVITAYVQESSDGWVPPFVRASWTANSNLNKTISDMYIDGRDHDLNLNITPKTGRFGVSSSVKFVNVQNAAIGGTKDSVDYPMTYPENPKVIEEYYNWGGTFPESPDEVLGYPEGTLKSIAQSGAQGSKYYLNPPKLDSKYIDFPLTGVTYIELTDGIERQLMFEGHGNGGIVVVHGPGVSSRLKGIKMKEKDSIFTGLLITDYSFHHHLDVLGAIIQLSPNLELYKECKGNKDHWVYYSSKAIENATKIAAEESALAGNNPSGKGAGFGNRRLAARHWFE